MAHSVELLFDDDTDAAIRRDWSALAEAGLPSQARHRSPTNRPHVTLSVSGRIDPQVDAALSEPAGQLPVECRVGAPMLFGHAAFTLVRLIVPTVELLRLQGSVDAICGTYMTPGPFAHSRPGEWTPHVTLCRRLAPGDVAAALAVVGVDDVEGAFAALRRWDGDEKLEFLIN
ncbi:MAG: hypothetical protein QOK02_558 [Mycobacterium sp.]|jgi:2'-5' RNA ligase|nr:hypothetical protein [Mycobacterium sp.]